MRTLAVLGAVAAAWSIQFAGKVRGFTITVPKAWVADVVQYGLVAVIVACVVLAVILDRRKPAARTVRTAPQQPGPEQSE